MEGIYQIICIMLLKQTFKDDIKSFDILLRQSTMTSYKATNQILLLFFTCLLTSFLHPHSAEAQTTYGECGGNLMEEWGYVQSPNYPTDQDPSLRYPGNQDCTWRMRGQADTLVRFLVYDLAIEPGDGGSNTSCEYDYLNFTITSIGAYTFCGFHRPEIEFRGMGSLIVNFHSDDSVNYRGFKGAYQREHNHDPCVSSPCVNGQCQISENRMGTVCICNPGFTGQLCRYDINECQSYPCQNGGVCSDAPNQYECQCPLGWGGTNCENVILHPCEYEPCLNEGTCVRHENYEFECVCSPGYDGETCDIETGCGNPGIPYLDSIRRFDVDTLLQFSCVDGYDMFGESSTKCQGDGTWSIDIPECKKNENQLAEENKLSPWSQAMIGLGSLLTINIVIWVSYLAYKSPTSVMERMRSLIPASSAANTVPTHRAANVSCVSARVRTDAVSIIDLQ